MGKLFFRLPAPKTRFLLERLAGHYYALLTDMYGSRLLLKVLQSYKGQFNLLSPIVEEIAPVALELAKSAFSKEFVVQMLREGTEAMRTALITVWGW